MEALSFIIPKDSCSLLLRTPSSYSSSSLRTLLPPLAFFKTTQHSYSPNLLRLRISSLPNTNSDEPTNDFALASHPQENLSHIETESSKDDQDVLAGSGPGGGTRAGLFRTPISGGVQSAPSVHGLPRQALAVRNLMEQARFAHLCTVMSRMHHRREGYPFGSLVDFAPDPTGHPIFSFSPLHRPSMKSIDMNM